jgi:hypothetical protein
MWLLAIVIFAACKLITWLAASCHGAPAWRHFAYLFAWPGLDAATFLDGRSRSPRPSKLDWLGGAI